MIANIDTRPPVVAYYRMSSKKHDKSIPATIESGCDFAVCDNPHASPLSIHILAAVAEARGVRLGTARKGRWRCREHRRGWKAATKAAALARMQAASRAYAFIVPTMQAMRDVGATYGAIAARLNSDGHSTRAGKPWTATAAWRVLRRNVVVS